MWKGDISMSKFSNALTAVAVLPVLAIAGSAYATTGGNGQIEQGDIYRAKDVTTNTAFADNISAACGDTVEFRVRIHNGGPETLTNVHVAATLDQSSSTKSHGSQVSLSADNNLHDAVVTANAGVSTDKATSATFVSGSTQLLDYSTTPGGENVLRNLPDGILGGGINIGSIGPLTTDTEEVQFQAKLNCPTPPVTPPVTPPTTPPATPAAPTALVNTGPGSTIALFAVATAAGTVMYRRILARRLNRG
jgi:uncharacterized repeat protein (TIGR01451 family)